jgi:FHS family L-fucose permease-like MFS transporter
MTPIAVETSSKPFGTELSRETYLRTMTVMNGLFFSWGFVTALNDVLIPQLKAVYSLDYTRAMLVQFCFFAAYLVFSLPCSKLLANFGYKASMSGGLLTMALGAFLFIPATLISSFAIFLIALSVISAGMTSLQVSANGFVAGLGSDSTSSSRLNLAQAFNSVGTTIAPYIGSILVFRHISASHKVSPESLRLPYVGIGITLTVMALFLQFVKFPSIGTGLQTTPLIDFTEHRLRNIFKLPHVLLGALAIFLYVGAEVAIGSFLVNYLVLPDTGALTVETAGKALALYWGGAMVGRFAGAVILRKDRARIVLASAAACAFLLVLISMCSSGGMAAISIILVGLFNSIMFPTIFGLGVAKTGSMRPTAAGVLIMGIAGGAVIPIVEGLVADKIGVHYALIVPALCYVFVAYYGLRGSQVRRMKNKLPSSSACRRNTERLR